MIKFIRNFFSKKPLTSTEITKRQEKFGKIIDELEEASRLQLIKDVEDGLQERISALQAEERILDRKCPGYKKFKEDKN